MTTILVPLVVVAEVGLDVGLEPGLEFGGGGLILPDLPNKVPIRVARAEVREQSQQSQMGRYCTPKGKEGTVHTISIPRVIAPAIGIGKKRVGESSTSRIKEF